MKELTIISGVSECFIKNQRVSLDSEVNLQ